MFIYSNAKTWMFSVHVHSNVQCSSSMSKEHTEIAISNRHGHIMSIVLYHIQDWDSRSVHLRS